MSDSFDIEVLDTDRAVPESAGLPNNFVTVGQVGPDDLKVYIKQDVYRKIERFAAADTSREVGSILVGTYAEAMGKTQVIISDFIVAKHTDASASTLTFTHETWNYIHSEHERLCPKKSIVGWQHTHPNYGIFLSNYDLFIQENYFNLGFQVAYVVDPIRKDRGFFQNRNGKAEKLGGFYIYDEEGKTIKLEKPKKSKAKPIYDRPAKTSEVLIGLLGAAIIFLAANTFWMYGRYSEQSRTQLEQEARLRELENKLSEQQSVMDALQSADNDSDVQTSASGTDGQIYFTPYTVEEGDTLLSICQKNGVDYYSWLGIIKAVNGISDPNVISAGNIILLPKS